ncbi:MAG: hypothetical protein WCX46_01645 [Candidatus Paceibacterota bacterium]
MIEIKDLLLNFKNILISEGGKKEEICKIISEEIKTEIKTEDIKIKNGTLFLNIKPIYKNEIFIKKDKIFSRIKEILGKKTPTNFR